MDALWRCRTSGSRSSGTCREPRQPEQQRPATFLAPTLVLPLHCRLAMHPAVALRSEIIDRRWLRWHRMIVVPVAVANVVVASMAGLPKIRVVALAAVTAVFVG